MTTDDGGQLELWAAAAPHAQDTPMVLAAKASLAKLADVDRLPPERAVLAQLVLSLATAIDGGARSGRASAVAMAAAQLRETMLILDPPPEDANASADANRRLADFIAALEAAAPPGGGAGDVVRLAPVDQAGGQT